MPSPFGTLPLSIAPYNSRYQTKLNLDPSENFYLLPFNPGYALQASELNEIQELFFINQSLTQRMNANWMREGFNIPFWEGAIPLDPNYITINAPISFSGSTLTINITVNEGWYLWTDFTSKLSFWIYNDQAFTSQEEFTAQQVNANAIIGFEVLPQVVSCCAAGDCTNSDENAPTIQDDELRDNSQGNTVTENTCGASRFKMSFTEVQVRITGTYSTTFLPLLQYNSNGTATFIDGQSITVPATDLTAQ
jgi:hypothetical protein